MDLVGMTLGCGSAGNYKYGGLGYDRAFAGYQKLLRNVKGCSMLNNYFKKKTNLQHDRNKNWMA